MSVAESIIRVFVIGLVFGAGLPALFAVGLRLWANGYNADGTVTNHNPVLKALGGVLFAVVTLAIIIGILWITRQTIYFHFGIKIFPFGYK
ncbi:hypothetical protein GOARA_088_00150 [Gordonia araii NBRC 100433]|uniref:Uncharacterized protein n=1 Tax=Gordonia araii NBRC 100433 TaxID=1073574 RepID=G7H7C7_9ACTN|nr:hypothetical protein [Gordonia araii]NNG98435.1 hypothetical protein [Gordonia araii NBRC 100433]GAB11752.1 hypothetical protein GOARA_088_00150 [Gordonia araii NBRC 100433]